MICLQVLATEVNAKQNLTALCPATTVTTQLNFAADKAVAGQHSGASGNAFFDGFRHDYLARAIVRINDSQRPPSKDLFLRFTSTFLITTPSSPACTRGATGLSAIRFTTGRLPPLHE